MNKMQTMCLDNDLLLSQELCRLLCLFFYIYNDLFANFDQTYFIHTGAYDCPSATVKQL